MKICLVTSPRWNCRPRAKSLAPLGLAYLGAVARQAGHEVVGVEGVLIGYPRAIAERVAACEPDVVGTSTATIDRLAGLQAIREIRRAVPKAFLVAGGSHFSHSAEDAMQAMPEIDAVAVGEGENTFLELLERLKDREALGEVQGLVYRDADGRIVRNPPRQLMRDIDHLPMPAWDLFGADQYRFHMIDKNATPVAGVMTTRGCPQNCVFCANSLNKRMRYLDPALAVDQLQWLQKTYGVSGLNIYDDDFLTSRKHVTAFCEELLRRDSRFSWWCGARAARLDADVLALMRRAGCKCISFGIETGTDEVLKATRKNLTCDQILEAMTVAGKIGFEQINIFLIIGLPAETPDTIDRTVAFVRSLRPLLGKAWHRESLIGQLPLIYPGTELETLGLREGCLPESFSWNRPYREPKRHLPLINHRYDTVPHFASRLFPLEKLCAHVKAHHWDELSAGRRRRYRTAALRRLKVAMHLG